MKVEAHVTITKNKTVAWEVITNIRDAADIISGIEKIEMLNEPANGLVGLKWRETRMYFGKPASIDKWITGAVEYEFYNTRAEMDGYVFLTTMAMADIGDNIRLTSSHETRAQTVMAKIKSIPMIFFKPMLKKAILRDLNDIKKAVESN